MLKTPVYQAWTAKCQSIMDTARRQTSQERAVIVSLVLLQTLEKKKIKRCYSKKRFWVHPLFRLRRDHGFYEAIYPTLALYGEKYQNYFRMNAVQFDELLSLVGPVISKQNLNRDSIPAAARLALTLRYLATGDCMTSMSYQYLIGVTTACNIIAETCQALWSCLCKEVLPYPLQTEDWLKIAEEFENQWQFNHCIGAIDGKHVTIQCPKNAGSAYFNYKSRRSIVLMAICDANYKYTFADIGAYGRRSDGGIFKDSEMGQKFKEGSLNLPHSTPLTVDGMPMPYVLVGDEAFQLTNFLLRPYPGRGGLSEHRAVFNYHLSRARRTIENAFGILVSQWRILKKPIEASVDTAIKMVQAIICLHNFLRKQKDCDNYIPAEMVDQDGPDGLIPGLWKQGEEDSALRDNLICGNQNSSQSAVAIREEFRNFFCAEGAVP